jgi:sugar (pentulose or hexulose) kinase
MTYQGKPVKASRLFAGNEHEIQTKRIADFFGMPTDHYKSIKFDQIYSTHELEMKQTKLSDNLSFTFSDVDLSEFSDYESAYYALMKSITDLQIKSTNLVLKNSPVKKIFVDGGFGKNDVFMGMLKSHYPDLEVYSSVVAQASALGAAMALHRSWNSNALPNKLIELKRH